MIYNPTPTSEKTQLMSFTETNQLILFREIIAVYCENYTKHINALYKKTSENISVKSVCAYK
jgi:hypothetical protein